MWSVYWQCVCLEFCWLSAIMNNANVWAYVCFRQGFTRLQTGMYFQLNTTAATEYTVCLGVRFTYANGNLKHHLSWKAQVALNQSTHDLKFAFSFIIKWRSILWVGASVTIGFTVRNICMPVGLTALNAIAETLTVAMITLGKCEIAKPSQNLNTNLTTSRFDEVRSGNYTSETYPYSLLWTYFIIYISG